MQGERGNLRSLKKASPLPQLPVGPVTAAPGRGSGDGLRPLPRGLRGGSGSFLCRAVALQRSGLKIVYLIYGFYNHVAGILETNSSNRGIVVAPGWGCLWVFVGNAQSGPVRLWLCTTVHLARKDQEREVFFFKNYG